MNLNNSQWLTLLRTAAKWAGAYLVTRGVMTPDQAGIIGSEGQIIIGAITALVPVACDLYVHTFGAKVAAINKAGGQATHPDVAMSSTARSSPIATVLGVALMLPMLVGGCILTNSQGQPVVLTTSTAPSLIVAEMKKGCADLMANQALVNLAVSKATQALQDTQGTITTVSNAASIGCSLLVPAPAAPAPTPAASG